ncbi:MAG: hypothetical protein IJZ19_02860 [Lentisphaeria bacterium]|nr:hypothetical protein [Lentisphaeria bacterium]
MQVTQKNLYNLIPPKAAKITTMLRSGRNMAVKQALLTFYSSRAYRLLEREETKLWHSSPAQIFAEYLSVPKRSRKSYQNGPGRSKLAPYAEKIKEWQAEGMTLREIAAELKHYGCTTTAQNISLFLRRKR